MAALVGRLGSFELAEDALQEASIAALSHWGRSGLPNSPRAWLFKAAFRKALDRLRGDGRARRREEAIAQFAPWETVEDAEEIPDDRLRLIFTCCHPALELKSRVALTLRTVCGLPTNDIARLFLDAEPAMGQRLSRAKTKIAAAGIGFAAPDQDQWDDRLLAVLTTIYLIYTSGYTTQQRDLCNEAIFLGRLLGKLCPDQPEVEGALALMLLTDARHAARIGPDGATVPPAEQDRRLWDAGQTAEGKALLQTALGRRKAGPFQIKAAIGACHMEGPPTDWAQVADLYAMLLAYEPTPVVRLNHAVALAETGNTAAAVHILDELRPELATFQPFQSACAAVLSMSGDIEGARSAYRTAIANAPSAADRMLLVKRLDLLD
jgi:RNA polymerase sigma-70 factor (ECF subfamily)